MTQGQRINDKQLGVLKQAPDNFAPLWLDKRIVNGLRNRGLVACEYRGDEGRLREHWRITNAGRAILNGEGEKR